MSTTIHGRCLCGYVRYEYDGVVGPANYCHCEDCRRCTGGPFNIGVRLRAADFRITAGAPKGFTKRGDSGRALTRHFCPECGSPLFTSAPRHPEHVYVKAGTLDDTSRVVPRHQIWVVSAVPWSRVDPELPGFARGPESAPQPPSHRTFDAENPPSGPRLPKYARWEHERKFLVAATLPRPWTHHPSWRIEDRYLDESRLRLRSMTNAASGESVYKLCKKFPSDSACTQAIVNIYLEAREHELLRALPGREFTKQRFHDRFDGRTFSIDVFEGALEGLVLCEIEAPTREELEAIEFPPYARLEVTEDAYFTGGSLSRTSAAELARRLRDVA